MFHYHIRNYLLHANLSYWYCLINGSTDKLMEVITDNYLTSGRSDPPRHARDSLMHTRDRRWHVNRENREVKVN